MITDCHIHSFAKGISRPGAAYAPPEKDLSDYLADEAQANGITRAVVVQASVDGTDPTALLAALAQRGIETRGVCMIDQMSGGLEALARAGIRAARVQDSARLGASQLDALPALAAKAAEVDWHMELNTAPARFDRVAEALRHMPEGQALVLDHFGHVDPARPAEADALCRLLDLGRVYVKLAPTRVTARTGAYDDLEPLMARLVQDYPERCLWGSDWPHVMTPDPVPRLAPMLDLCRRVLTGAQQAQVLTENPARLYRF